MPYPSPPSWTLPSPPPTALALDTALSTLTPPPKFSLAVDALDSHVEAVFQQLVCGSWAPLAFFSKKLFSTESCYLAFKPELLAAFFAMGHFHFLLNGRDFTLFAIHKPLTGSLFRVSLPWLAQQQRQLSFISKFISNLLHLGSQNVVADALSHPSPLSPLASLPFPVSTVQPLPASPAG